MPRQRKIYSVLGVLNVSIYSVCGILASVFGFISLELKITSKYVPHSGKDMHIYLKENNFKRQYK